MDYPFESIAGFHSYFLYYGIEHLMINLYSYISAGIRNNEKTVIYMEQELYDGLFELFKKYDVRREHVELCKLKDLIEGAEDPDFVYHRIKSAECSALMEGCGGIRWIVQATLAVKDASRRDFLAFERILSDVIRDTGSSFLCLYDFYDYTHEKEYMDEELLSGASEAHTHLLHKFELTSAEA